MGVFKMFSSSSNECDCGKSNYIYKENVGNPNPFKFEILKRSNISRDKIALLVYYPNCTNFEGKKIIVLSKNDYKLVIKTNKLDPHFSNKGQTVLARFQPTTEGWNDAIKYVKQ